MIENVIKCFIRFSTLICPTSVSLYVWTVNPPLNSVSNWTDRDPRGPAILRYVRTLTGLGYVEQ